MDGGFPSARGLTRAQRREALAVLGPERGRGIEGRDRACGRGPALSDRARGGFARAGLGYQEDLQR